MIVLKGPKTIEGWQAPIQNVLEMGNFQEPINWSGGPFYKSTYWKRPTYILFAVALRATTGVGRRASRRVKNILVRK